MIRLLLALALSVFAANAALAQTIILVRHAEKADQSRDPALSEAGVARAQALALALRDAPVTNILVSPLRRTRLTAQPAATARALTPEPISLDGGDAAHVERIVQRIDALPPGAVVLIVGHSNTIPLIAAALGQTVAQPMEDCEYDRLTVITLTGGDPSSGVTVVGRYGAPSACPTAPAPAR